MGVRLYWGAPEEEYVDLMADCREKSRKAMLFLFEDMCKGFLAQSVWQLFQGLGMVS